MKTYNKWIAGLALCLMIINTNENVHSREYATDAGGYAYEDAYSSCCIAPAIALALVAIAAIIAVGVHNRSHSSHDHSHAH